jgi:hypothetical protein
LRNDAKCGQTKEEMEEKGNDRTQKSVATDFESRVNQAEAINIYCKYCSYSEVYISTNTYENVACKEVHGPPERTESQLLRWLKFVSSTIFVFERDSTSGPQPLHVLDYPSTHL